MQMSPEGTEAGTEHEALRAVALAAASAGAPEAPELARAYAELCATSFSAPVPLPWPRRTAGSRLRVVVLLPVHANDAAGRAIAGLLALSSAAFDLMFATVGPRASDVMDLLPNAAMTVAELKPVPIRFVNLGDQFGESGAPDALLEKFGMTAAKVVEAAQAAIAAKVR